MNAGNAGMAVGLLVIVAAVTLIFATGGLAIPIGIVLIVFAVAGMGARATRGRRAPESKPATDPAQAGPGAPLRNEEESTVFVGTGEQSDPLASEKR